MSALEIQQPDDVSYEALDAGHVAETGDTGDLSLVLDVPVEVSVEVGRTTMTIRETLAIAPGSIIPLDRMAGEPVDLLVNGRRIARGEVVVVDEEFGLRITEIGLADGDGDTEAGVPAGEARFDERGLDEELVSGELLDGGEERAA
jgi:flagellar motor switch protein FliN/FliY